jgi:hypothetical protein
LFWWAFFTIALLQHEFCAEKCIHIANLKFWNNFDNFWNWFLFWQNLFSRFFFHGCIAAARILCKKKCIHFQFFGNFPPYLSVSDIMLRDLQKNPWLIYRYPRACRFRKTKQTNQFRSPVNQLFSKCDFYFIKCFWLLEIYMLWGI